MSPSAKAEGIQVGILEEKAEADRRAGRRVRHTACAYYLGTEQVISEGAPSPQGVKRRNHFYGGAFAPTEKLGF